MLFAVRSIIELSIGTNDTASAYVRRVVSRVVAASSPTTGKFSSQTGTSIPWSSGNSLAPGVYNGDSVREDVRDWLWGHRILYRIEGARSSSLPGICSRPSVADKQLDAASRARSDSDSDANPPAGCHPSGEFDAEKLQYVDFVVPLVDTEGNPAWFEHPWGYLSTLRHDSCLTFRSMGCTFFRSSPKMRRMAMSRGLGHAGCIYRWPPIRSESRLPVADLDPGLCCIEPSLFFNYKEDEYPLFLVDSERDRKLGFTGRFLMRRHFTDLNTDGDALPRSRLLGVYTGRSTKNLI